MSMNTHLSLLFGCLFISIELASGFYGFPPPMYNPAMMPDPYQGWRPPSAYQHPYDSPFYDGIIPKRKPYSYKNTVSDIGSKPRKEKKTLEQLFPGQPFSTAAPTKNNQTAVEKSVNKKPVNKMPLIEEPVYEEPVNEEVPMDSLDLENVPSETVLATTAISSNTTKVPPKSMKTTKKPKLISSSLNITSKPVKGEKTSTSSSKGVTKLPVKTHQQTIGKLLDKVKDMKNIILAMPKPQMVNPEQQIDPAYEIPNDEENNLETEFENPEQEVEDEEGVIHPPDRMYPNNITFPANELENLSEELETDKKLEDDITDLDEIINKNLTGPQGLEEELVEDAIEQGKVSQFTNLTKALHLTFEVVCNSRGSSCKSCLVDSECFWCGSTNKCHYKDIHPAAVFLGRHCMVKSVYYYKTCSITSVALTYTFLLLGVILLVILLCVLLTYSVSRKRKDRYDLYEKMKDDADEVNRLYESDKPEIKDETKE